MLLPFLALFFCACAHVSVPQLPNSKAEPPILAKPGKVPFAAASLTLPAAPKTSVSICEGTSTVVVLADPTEDDVRDIEEDDDDEIDIYVSTSVTVPPPPRNLGGDGQITIHRRDNGEQITVRYRKNDGTYDYEELAKINHIMRCSITGRETQMAVLLVEALDSVEDRFGAREITLLSGYRTPELNRVVPGAAKNSLHMLGWAADIRIPGRNVTAVKNFALTLGVGGVGFYPSMGFTHLDVGRIRYWVTQNRRCRRSSKRKKRRRPHALVRSAKPSAAIGGRKSKTGTAKIIIKSKPAAKSKTAVKAKAKTGKASSKSRKTASKRGK